MRPRSNRPPLGLLAVVLLSGACASYPRRTAPAREAFARGRFDEALERLPAESEGPDRMLRSLERGLVAHTAGDFQGSVEEFATALEAIREFEDRPTVSGRSVVESAESWVWNDLSLPYDGEGFERVLLHTYLALDYLFLGALDDARVELKRANLVAKEEEARAGARYAGQNAFAWWVSGLVYEGMGLPEDALLDYRAAQEAAPDSVVVRRDLLRLARELGRTEEAERLRGAFGDLDTATDPSAGEIVVLYASGLGPIKHAIEMAVPTLHTVTKIAVPDFERRPNPADRVRLLEGASVLGETERVEDLEATAIRNLRDRIARIAAKAVARAAVKGAVGEALAANRRDPEGAFLVSVVATVFNLVSEQADLRSWLTLPANFQALRVEVPPGVHDLTLQLIGENGSVLNTRAVDAVEVGPGRRVYLNLRSVDDALFVAVIGGGPGPADADPAGSPEGLP